MPNGTMNLTDYLSHADPSIAYPVSPISEPEIVSDIRLYWPEGLVAWLMGAEIQVGEHLILPFQDVPTEKAGVIIPFRQNEYAGRLHLCANPRKTWVCGGCGQFIHIGTRHGTRICYQPAGKFPVALGVARAHLSPRCLAWLLTLPGEGRNGSPYAAARGGY